MIAQTGPYHVIDGAPAACFLRRLVELIESGYGLGEENIHAKQSTTKQDRQE
jgi:hypothetical protein